MSGPYRVADRLDYVLEACREKRVLHVGCADAPLTEDKLAQGLLLHALIESVAARQHGIDISEEGLRVLQEGGFSRVALADIAAVARGDVFPGLEIDVIVAGELIEHLSNPGDFLEAAARLMDRNPGCRLLITTPNAMGAYRFAFAVLTGREWVNPDHTSYYSRTTLAQLLGRYGFDVVDFAYYPAGRERRRLLRRGAGWILWWTDRLAARVRPGLADGLLVLCARTRNADG
jgi:2-polyprenyl-3-methyl-5-hydroxy-6-metoxy-1,4-benzoquinol methylase